MTGNRRSPLDAMHRELGAKMVPFGGWEMPLSYPSGTITEHMACRSDATWFDVSHLGTVRLEGPQAFGILQEAFTNDLRKVSPGRAQYTHSCNDDGGVVDDIIIWWIDEQTFDVMPNASNTASILEVIGGVDTTSSRAVLAVQGPQARRKLARVSAAAAAVKRFRVEIIDIEGVRCVVAGTGYTGEDGVEIAAPVDAADRIARALLAAEVPAAGLGARDTLRLEAALPLHGHELSPTITSLEADLSWVVGWEKDRFRGKNALERQRISGPSRKLCGIRTNSRRPPRDGARVSVDGIDVGVVTSGNYSPVLGVGIALALVEADRTAIGTQVELAVRDSTLTGEIVTRPFIGR
ncbi:MAG: glycine cleavage system aminomethyltransferase GcvT [Actinomycetota bacterium]